MKKILGIGASFLALSVVIAEAQSEPILARAQVVGGSATTCPAIFISFNTPLNYASHFFSGDGNSLMIRLVGDIVEAREIKPELIETYPQISVPGLGEVRISLNVSGTDPILTLQFSQPVTPQISQAGDSSIVISELALLGGAQCGVAAEDETLEAESGEADGETDFASDVEIPDQGPVSDDPELSEVETSYVQARSAITAGENARAIQILTKLISMPDHARSADAQELLGVVRERNDQLAHAKAEYEIYLEKFPEEEGATRVQQRLAAILTAEATAPAQLREAGPGYSGPNDAFDTQTADLQFPRRSGGFRPLRQEELPEIEEPTFFASVSSYYYLNQGSTQLNEFTTGTTTTDDDVFQNSLVTSLDMSDSRETDTLKFSWRIAGDHELDFNNSSQHSLSFSRAYGEVEIKESGLAFKLGRQTRNDGGIFGRFDGALVSWPANENYTLKATLGQPVDSSSDDFFSSDRLLYGVSVDALDIRPNLDMTAYFVQQKIGSFTDRSAVGVEGQYLDDNTSVFASLDYDLTFGQVNSARISGTRIMANTSSFTVSADYTHSPLLTLGNALQGQAVLTLSELSATYSLGQMEQLALDRTTTTASLTAAYSAPLNDSWQLSVDGSIFDTSGTPASGGVAAVPSTGLEFYTSAQIVGTGIFSERDVVSFSARYADTASSKLILLDAYRRYQFSDELRLQPRLKVGHRDITSTGGTELFAIPSVTATYSLNRTTDLELELGGRVSDLSTPSFAEESNELFVVAGFRKDF